MQAWKNGTRSSWRRLSSKSTARSRYPGQQEMFVAVHGHRGHCRLGIHRLSRPHTLGSQNGFCPWHNKACPALGINEGQCIDRCLSRRLGSLAFGRLRLPAA